jgi:Flp pilus assembly pilin Flp
MIELIRRLHRDEKGDATQVVIVAALIIIPLIMCLIFFGQQIQQWLSDAFGKLSNAPKIPGSL